MRAAVDWFGAFLLVAGTVVLVVFPLALSVVKDTPPDGAQ